MVKKLKALSLRKGCPYILLLNTLVGILYEIIRQEKERKGIQIGKKQVKLFVGVGEMIQWLRPLANLAGDPGSVKADLQRTGV